MYKVHTQQSVGDLPLLSYSSMVHNAFLWSTYGVLKQEPSVLVSNGVGFVMGILYCGIYIKYSQELPSKAQERTSTKGSSQNQTQFHLLCMAFIMGVCLTIASATILSLAVRTEVIGIMGIVACVALFASPLAALQTVIEKQSAAAIPFPFTVASGVNCLLWTITGLFQMHDLNIILPNTLGLGCALIQLALKIAYRDMSKPGHCLCGSSEGKDDEKRTTLLDESHDPLQQDV